MTPANEASGEYWIDVNTVTDPERDCYVAKVVVTHLPEMREIFRGEFPASGLPRARRKDVLAAALASGQHAVRMEQCRLIRR
ncbi:MAG: hypothetical protein H0U56_00835 [Methylibium sp.]|uniref:hypothetical protein n=1 Tax=Methylibium sp. TaxID=2067992 RepID=UPI0018159D4B|nr:hypothetical protein [Methylibium sp.]MBA2721452.1 hypothetical protein [Methylibium sp.]MBA3592031.1 hypothetical protein [Methylibium sp.]